MKRIQLHETNLIPALKQAALTIEQGGLVLYPTETVYGVAVDPTNPEAVSKLLAYKNRPAGKAISVLVADDEMASYYVKPNDTALRLISTFLPGPLTVVCANAGAVDKRIPSEFDTLGIRISSHPVAMQLSQTYGKAVTATSANASGRGRAYSIDTILEGLSDKQLRLIDLILDYGTLPPNDPSTVIDTTKEVQQLVRGGSLAGKISQTFISNSEEDTIRYAEQLMQSYAYLLLEKTVVFVVDGDLGAGKTRFAKGIAQGLEVNKNVNSPTYTIMKEYEGADSVQMIHLDCWRMENVTAQELGLPEKVHPGTVIVAEWAHSLLPYFQSIPDKASICHLMIESTTETSRTIHLIA